MEEWKRKTEPAASGSRVWGHPINGLRVKSLGFTVGFRAYGLSEGMEEKVKTSLATVGRIYMYIYIWFGVRVRRCYKDLFAGLLSHLKVHF